MRMLVVVGLAAAVVLLGARAAADAAGTSPFGGESRSHVDARRFGNPRHPGGPRRVFRPPRRLDDARNRQVDRSLVGPADQRSSTPGPTPFGAGGPTPFGAGGSAPFGAGGSPP